MSSDTKSVASTIVDTAIAEWLELVKTDATLDRAQFLNRYPSVRTALQRFFENYDAVHERLSAPNEDVLLDGGTPPNQIAAPVHSIVTAVTIKDVGEGITSVTTNARFQGMKQFNKGGLGDLYKALDESLHRETVIKIANDRAASDSTLLSQFRIEAEITGRLDHPGVVPVYGIGEDWNGRPFYVMQLVKGHELAQSIREYHELRKTSPKASVTRRQLMTLLEYLVSVCKTIAYAHDVGIIHCDIKPANIMVGKFGETLVLDWGLATTFERTKTFIKKSVPILRPRTAEDSSTSGPRGGTYGYISPEQLNETDPVTPASDVYSLGATLYEILTGKPPFDAHDPNVADKIQAGKFLAPHLLESSVSRRLEAICLKALRLSPSDRYSTATLLAQELTSWMRNDELLVLPDRWYHRIARFASRHRGIAISIAISTVIVAGIGAWTIHQSERHHFLEREEAQKTKLETERRKFMEIQNEIVQSSLDTSLETLEQICRPVSNGELHNLNLLLPAIDEIKKFAEHYLESFNSNGDKKEFMRRHTGRVYELLATVCQVPGSDTEKVIEYYEEAEKTYAEQIRVDSVDADKYKLPRRLIDVQINKSRVYIQRELFPMAKALLETAKASAAKLQKQEEYSSNRDLRRDIAEISHLLGQVYLSQDAVGNESTEALETAKRSFVHSIYQLTTLIDEVAQDGIEKRGLKRDLARSHGYLGDVYLAQGYVSKAERAYSESLEIRHELHRINNFDPETRFQLARGQGNFGWLERNYGRDLKVAQSNLEETQKLQLDLLRDFPLIKDFQRDLAFTQNSLAEVYLWQSTNDETDEKAKSTFLEKAFFTSQNAGQNLQNDVESKHGLAWSRVTQAAVLTAMERRSEAEVLAKTAETILIEWKSPTDLGRGEKVTLAIALALQGDSQIERAFSLLKDAVNHGENTFARFERHRKASLKSLNNHEGFNKLCADVRKSIKNE